MGRERGFRMSATAPLWWRGAARRDGDVIVVDRADAREYSPLEEKKIAFDLASILSPEKAAEFVEQYGLLTVPLDAAELRESYQTFETAAATFRLLFRTTKAIR